MTIYFLRWRTVGTTIAPIIFLVFFIVTGVSFAVRFFFYDERLSYISAFISPLVFSLAIFIPPNTVMIDARRIVRGLTFLFSAGSIFYLIEAVIKPLDIVRSLTPLGEVQIHKSLICVLALCLCILTGRKALGIFIAIVTTDGAFLAPRVYLGVGASLLRADRNRTSASCFKVAACRRFDRSRDCHDNAVRGNKYSIVALCFLRRRRTNNIFLGGLP